MQADFKYELFEGLSFAHKAAGSSFQGLPDQALVSVRFREDHHWQLRTPLFDESEKLQPIVHPEIYVHYREIERVLLDQLSLQARQTQLRLDPDQHGQENSF